MNTIAFIGNSEPPDKLLNIFKKMTPGSKGIWGNLVGVPSYQEAEYFGVIDCLPSQLQHFESRSIFLGAHPPESHYAYQNMRNQKCIAKFDCAETVGFLEWWIKYDYDYLNNLQPMIKTKNYAAIVSNAETQSYHKKRLAWLKRYCDGPSREDFHLYGRINQLTPNMEKHYKGHCGNQNHTAATDHMIGKEEVYESHKYMIEFDAEANYYFSERILDSILLWCFPIYWGCKNLHTFIPKEVFAYLDINASGEDVNDIIGSGAFERALPYMADARDILLNELQLWPRIHNAIYGTYNS